MPIYEFRCAPCDLRFEELCRTFEAKASCPKCGSGKADRVFSLFSAHTGSPNPSTSAASHCNGHGGCGACGCASGPSG